MIAIPVAIKSSSLTLKFDMTSCSIAAISSSLRDVVTVFVTSKVATKPVIEGMALGMLVSGAGIG